MKSIKQTMISRFLILALITFIVSLVGAWSLITLNRNAQTIAATNDYSSQADHLESILYQQERNYLLLINGEPIEKPVFSQLHNEFLQTLEQLEQHVDIPQALPYLNTIGEIYRSNSSLFYDRLSEAARTGDMEAADREIQKLIQYVDIAIKNAHKLVEVIDAENEALIVSGVTISHGAVVALLIAGLMGMILAFLFGIVQARRISTPIVKLTNAAKSLAAGDINVDVEVTAKNELGTLSGALQLMVDGIVEEARVLTQAADGVFTERLVVRSGSDVINSAISHLIADSREIVWRLQETADQLTVATKQIADGAQKLAVDSAQQAASVQELSATVGQMKQESKKNAEAVEKAAAHNKETICRLAESQTGMNSLQASMEETSKSAKNNVKVNDTIKNIAFQIKMLSLNIAAAGARMGRGKEIGVMAQEGQRLAEISSKAVLESAELIDGTLARIQKDNQLLLHTHDQLETAIEASNQFTRLMDGVACDSRNQAQEIEEINLQLEQISSVIQSNSIMSEQFMDFSRSLLEQAQAMQAAFHRFVLVEQH